MEISIKNSTVLKPEFLMAVQRLLQSRNMPAKTSIEINTAIDEIVSHINILSKSRKDVVKRYANLDEKGEPIVGIDNNYVFPDDTKRTECRKAVSELESESITITLTNPVVIYDDEQVSPIDLRFLRGIVEVKEKPKE